MRSLTELLDFLDNKMSMTEIYQLVIIRYLLEKDGRATKAELAQVLSGYDTSVQAYYQSILMRWPKITLTKHNIVTYERGVSAFSLNFALDNEPLVEVAKQVCEEKIEQWIEKKAEREAQTPALASLRYRVLKAARGKCELCGISSKVSPIDIDHIIPQSRADKNGYIIKEGIRMLVDDERNLQALCFRCNRAKRDNDTTDFRLPERKFVRDRIPDTIASNGQLAVTRTIKGQQLMHQLLEKLTEEHAELIADNEIEEVVDMLEVLLAIAKLKGHSEAETLQLLHEKRAEKGGFDRGIFLEEIRLLT